MFPILMAVPWISPGDTSPEGRATLQIVRECGRKTGKVSIRPGLVWFLVDRAFSPQSSALDNSRALNALLACAVGLNRIYRKIAPNQPPLMNSGVYYQRTTIWDTYPALVARGHGDCKSLTAQDVAEALDSGISAMPVFRFVKLGKDGKPVPFRGTPGGAIFADASGVIYHILTAMFDNNGQKYFRDRSKELGMSVPQEFLSGATGG
jgi:hypothetical protein